MNPDLNTYILISKSPQLAQNIIKISAIKSHALELMQNLMKNQEIPMQVSVKETTKNQNRQCKLLPKQIISKEILSSVKRKHEHTMPCMCTII